MQSLFLVFLGALACVGVNLLLEAVLAALIGWPADQPRTEAARPGQRQDA